MKSRMESEHVIPMPTEQDIDRYTDEGYQRVRDEMSVDSIINRAKEKQ